MFNIFKKKNKEKEYKNKYESPVESPAYHLTEYEGLRGNDKKKMKPVVEENGLMFASLSPALQKDREMQEAAIKHSWVSLALLPEEAQNDEIIRKAWENHAYSGHQDDIPLEQRVETMRKITEKEVADKHAEEEADKLALEAQKDEDEYVYGDHQNKSETAENEADSGEPLTVDDLWEMFIAPIPKHDEGERDV